ncbi:pyridoxal phosphate-dependent aminotransferase [Pacificispira sp.]|uniref:pyridoxal phosphate-dependent aminotransferase n=1 Tax=Pacificispira sp. TaxID=2888761 RepID=UPI003BADADA0
MRFSGIADRVGGMGEKAWEIHRRAVTRHAAGQPIIVLSVGEDRTATTHPALVQVAKDALDQGLHHYSALTGSPAVKEGIARRHKALTGQTVAPEACCLFSGAQNALFATLMCLTDTGDEVIVPEPYYATYPGVTQASGAKMVAVKTDPESDFVLDPARLEAAVTDKTRVILLNSPNNPTGAVYPRSVMEAVADLCKRHDLWLISDEVYVDFLYDGEHVAPCTLPGMAERTVTIGSLSKSHRMSGWRIGWTVSTPEFSELLSDFACCMLYGSAPFIQEAAAAALAETPLPGVEEDRLAMLADYHRKRDIVMGALGNTPGLVLRRPSAGMFAMVDVRPTGLGDFDFAARLLDEEEVGVMTGGAFGPSAKGHIRLGLVAEAEMLREACTRIDRFARKIVAGG